MADADKLKNKIMDEAGEQFRAIMKRAEKEVEGIYKAAREEAGKKRSDILRKAEREVRERKKRAAAYAGLEARKIKLQAKQDMIDLAFSKAIDRLNSLPDKEYGDIVAKMILHAVRDGNEEIVLSAKDRTRLGAGLADTVNRALAARGMKAKVRMSDETRDLKGGFILKAGEVEINNSFDTVIRMRRDDLEADVVKALFGEGV